VITGIVDSALEARLTLAVLDVAGQPHDCDVVIDSGFSGFLTLPPSLIASLGLVWLSRQRGQLADGSIQLFDVYAATVMWDGQPRTVEVEEVDSQSLLGMSMLRNHEVCMEVKPGGPVTISPVP
jgi:clan AA aspartic protease